MLFCRVREENHHPFEEVSHIIIILHSMYIQRCALTGFTLSSRISLLPEIGSISHTIGAAVIKS